MSPDVHAQLSWRIAIVPAIAGLADLALLFFFVPPFGHLFAEFNSELPVIAKITFNTSAFFRQWALLTVPGWLAAIGGVVVLARAVSRTNRAAGYLIVLGASSLFALHAMFTVASVYFPVFEMAPIQ